MFRNLQRRAGGGAAEVDAQVFAGSVLPGDAFPGQVVLRPAGREARVETVVLRAVAEYPNLDTGEAEVDELGYQYVDGPFVMRDEQEHQARFSMRLPWETPITELADQALGPVVRLLTTLDDEDSEGGGAGHDLIHVSSLPLHEAIMSAFAAAGWTLQSSRLVGERVPQADQIFDFHQSFTLTDRRSAVGAPGDLEVVLLTNAVGCEVFVRPAAPEARYWADKPPAHRRVAAHHDLERVDWPTEISHWIDSLR
ncbi:sporulation protein [Actinomadura coerulea]|uniref:sporulation protein n=1 Tax=Actinomadura coerulea TaxID=46159 RepID=UPI003426D4E0